MADVLPYRAEYAKSGRASCRGCKGVILKDTLRLAAMVQSPMFDGKVPHWYHDDCFFEKQRPKSVGDISHLDQLRWEDQEKVKTRIENAGADPVPATKSGGRGKAKGKKAAAGISNDYRTEYAKSSQSTCQVCMEKIPKNEVRISKKDYETETAKMYGPADRWHHVDCFVKSRDTLEYFDGAEGLAGFKELQKDDQQMLKSKLPKMDRKRKAEDSTDGPPVKKTKEDIELMNKMKDQNRRMFAFRDQLKNLPKKDLQELLQHNSQEIPPGVDKMLDRLSDMLTFGALMPCSECNGQFVYRTGVGYQCRGNISEWAKCEVTMKEPKRKLFVVSEDLREEYSFLKKYKCKLEKRIIPDTPLPSQPSTSGFKSAPPKPLGPPLKNMKFVLTGNLAIGAEEMKKKIEALGGKITNRISEKLAAVISTPEAVKKMSKRIKDANAANVHVVSEDFVDELKTGQVAARIVEKSICTWGSDPKERITESEVDGVRKSGSSIFTSRVPSKMKLTLKGGAAVDMDSGLEDKAHVLQVRDEVYNAVLNLADVQSGKNSYYKIQVLESDKGKTYWVFRSWGRIGTTIGNTKLEKVSNKEEAIEQFKFQYEDKTGNSWSDRKNFSKLPGRYYPLDIDYGQENEKLQQATQIKPGANSKLPKAIQELVCMILDVESMKKAMVEFEIDLNKMPLGKLSKKQIQAAYRVLTELQELVKSGGSNGKFVDASNRFYTLIPHDFGMDAPPLLNKEEVIKQKIEMLDNLLEIEVAYNLLTENVEDTGKDPVDANYEKLKCDMEVLDKKSEEFRILEKYLKNTHGATHNTFSLKIDEVFKVERHSEDFDAKKISNHQLLWHGSRITNFAGILSQGLRIAPPEAPVTGYMFGKGIYFADMVSKSANYCCTSKSNPTGLLLLCEVALGNMYERTQAEYVERLPPKMHSTKGLGMTHPNPKDTVNLDGGLEVPLGKGVPSGVKNTSLLYNEFIVYDTKQVHIKYLLKVNFKHK